MVKKLYVELAGLAALKKGYGSKLLDITLKEFDGKWRHNKPGENLSFTIDSNELCYLLGLFNFSDTETYRQISAYLEKQFP